MHSQLIGTVVEDLQFLQANWSVAVGDAFLRQTSAVLRRLANHGDFSKAWRKLGKTKEPRIRAVDLAATFTELDRTRIAYAQAGGASGVGGGPVAMLLYRGPDPPPESEVVFSEWGISRFLQEPSFIIFGEAVRRRSVIKYVADKLGGAHFDEKRDLHREPEIALLENDSVEWNIGDRGGVLFELLSIGQAICRSEDTQQFLNDAVTDG